MSNSIIKSSFNQLGDLGKQTIKEVAKQPKKAITAAASQAGFERPEKTEGKEHAPKVVRNKDTEDFVKGLYGASSEDPKETNGTENPKGMEQVQTQIQNQNDQSKSPEEQAKMQQLQNKLHQEYYQRLISRPRKQEEIEKPKERVERLEMEDLQKKEEEKKKKAKSDEFLALEREQTKTEKRPGAG